MALAEGAARGILPRQAHRIAFVQQRAEGERFGGGPIEALPVSNICALACKLPRDGFVRVKAFGDRGQRAADLLQLFGGDGGVAAAVAFRRGGKALPAPVEPIGAIGQMRFGGFEFLVEPLVESRRSSRAHRPAVSVPSETSLVA